MNRFIIICLIIVSTSSFANNPVILLSIDGFSHDYLAQYQPKNILALANKGVMANGLTPVFPSKTFPNHLLKFISITKNILFLPIIKLKD